MPNKNYIKGRKKEYAIIRLEKAKGCIAFRSAGSHSCIDVVSIDTLHKIIRFIQSKPDDISLKEECKLLEDNKDLNGLFNCVFIVR